VASIQPGPTFDQGTALIVASTPWAAACAAIADVDVAGLAPGTGVEVVGEEHPATIAAANTTTPT
jgi:hypothetical protein